MGLDNKVIRESSSSRENTVEGELTGDYEGGRHMRKFCDG
jgi:hypothetical protein